MDPKDKAKIREDALRSIHRWMPLEVRKQRKQRAQERRASAPRKRPRQRSWSEDDETEVDVKLSEHRGQRSQRANSATGDEMVSFGDGPTALVVGIMRGRVRVLDDKVELDNAEFEADLIPELARTQQSSIAVGDVVELQEWRDSIRVVAVQPRTSSLARPDPGNNDRERVLAANIDHAAVVLSVVSPPLKPALIDRFLVALSYGGVAPVLCINKVDLLTTKAERDSVESILEPYRKLGIPCLMTSAESGEGIGELRALLADKTCVFTGHSGVGKSSLLNSLDPGHERDTGGVRTGDGKGRHTTTSSALRELESGTRLIDTPGIRTFGLWKLDANDLRRSFREFEPHALLCRFNDCTHVHEPDCEVVRVTKTGEIAASRHAAYLRLLDEI